MHNPTRNLLAGLLLLGSLTTSLHAQTPPAGDPFVKDPAAANAKADQPWQNVVGVLEVYTLDRDTAAATLESEQGSGARYRRIQELAGTGKARLETLTALVGKSGQRSALQAVDEVRYPKTFNNPTVMAGIAPPSEWGVREAGDSFEYEVVVGPDGRTCDVTLVPQRTRFLNFQDLPSMANDAIVAQPRFDTQRLTTSVTVTEGEPCYLGTLSVPSAIGTPPGGAAAETSLAFLHVFLPSPEPTELQPPTKAAPTNSVNFEYSWYSLERAQARELLLASASLAGPWEKLQALLKEKKARLEHLTTLNTKAGQRAVVEEVEELSYAKTYTPEYWEDHAVRVTKTTGVAEGIKQPAVKESSTWAWPAGENPARRPGFISESEMRKLGLTVEFEPVILKDGVSVDINQAIQSITFQGNLQATGAAAKYPAQPVFETRKIISTQTVLLGRNTFAGTFNPPGADGVNDRKDSGRTFVLFVRALSGQ